MKLGNDSYGLKHCIINAQRMCMRDTVLCVCYQFAGSISSQYDTFSVAIGFSLGLSDFELTDLSKMPSFLRKTLFTVIL